MTASLTTHEAARLGYSGFCRETFLGSTGKESSSVRLQTIMIFVSDIERMTAFYRDAVGLTFDAGQSNEDWAEFDAGGPRLALHRLPSAIAAEIEMTDPPRARAETALKVIFEVPDLPAARSRLMKFGATMLAEHGHQRCDALDPEGNVFQIVGV